MTAPMAEEKSPQVDAAVAQVMHDLYPRVQSIRYDFEPDWTGEWAIFFRVLLSDEAGKRENRLQTAKQVMHQMSSRLYVPDIGLRPYFHFRTVSEQAELNAPEWAPVGQ